MRDFKLPPKAKCPYCGSRDQTIPILYGEVEGSTAILEALHRGEIELGGCNLMGNDPTHHCKNCGQYFGHLKM